MFPTPTRVAILGLSCLLTLTGCPKAGGGDGTPVTVQVLDESGDPVSTAVVRHPQEEERHHVNAITGSWTANTLYLPGGEPLEFEDGMELTFEVSAPGYLTETIRYIVRKRKNVIVVELSEMDIKEDLDQAEDPMIQFGRDRPIDGQPIED